MKRLTRKRYGEYDLPRIPMLITSKEDLERFSEARQFYEACVKKLGEYEDLEEEGRIFRFDFPTPRIGDIVYYHWFGKTEQFVIINKTNEMYMAQNVSEDGQITQKFDFTIFDINRTVFLSYLDAEKRLEVNNEKG